MSQTPPGDGRDESRGAIKSPLDFGGGLFLIALAAVGYIGAFNLPVGTLSGVGSGLLPKASAVLIAAFGVLLVVQSLVSHGDTLERWSIRGPFFVLGAVVIFALTIRPLGLAIAGPLAVIFSSLADKDTRPVEVVAFSILMTALCIGLFKFLLHLPIPVFPPGYELF